MTAECNQFGFGFHPLKRREIRAQFDGGAISSDGGGLLLREVEKRMRILRQFAACFTDYRNADLIEHPVEELVAQRVYGLALGYEDLNDHEELRNDPLLAVLVEKSDLGNQALAGKSTLNRLELTQETASRKERYKKIVLDHGAVDRLLVQTFLEAYREAPQEIILDLDATDDPLHGKQEGRFFHGYYGHYCYLPLYIFCGEFLLCARLRSSNIDASAGSVEELRRIVAQIRSAWPQVRIVVRGDSGFCRELRWWWNFLWWLVFFLLHLLGSVRLAATVGTQTQNPPLALLPSNIPGLLQPITNDLNLTADFRSLNLCLTGSAGSNAAAQLRHRTSRPASRGNIYSSCASSTCNCASRVLAWDAKMSRINCVRSITRQGRACSSSRSCEGERFCSNTIRSAALAWAATSF